MGCFPFFKRARSALMKLFSRRNNKVIPISIPENKILGTNEETVEVVPQCDADNATKMLEKPQNKTEEECGAVTPKRSQNKNDIVTVEDLTLE